MMTNEDDKTMVQGGAEAQSPDAGEGKKGSSKKLILFGGIGAGVIALGIVLALFVIGPIMSDSSGEDGEQIEQSDSDKKPAQHAKPKKKKKSRGEHGEATIYSIKDIVINPAGTGGSRFLSVSISFELDSPEMAAEFEGRDPVIRDALITILSSKTVAQLTDTKQKEITRYQIKKRVSRLMETEEVAGVYYTDFVLQ